MGLLSQAIVKLQMEKITIITQALPVFSWCALNRQVISALVPEAVTPRTFLWIHLSFSIAVFHYKNIFNGNW